MIDCGGDFSRHHNQSYLNLIAVTLRLYTLVSSMFTIQLFVRGPINFAQPSAALSLRIKPCRFVR